MLVLEEKESGLDSKREEIIEEQKERLKPREMGEALLATAFVLSFFGSAAVLMPSGTSPTGMFSGGVSIEPVEIQESNIRSLRTGDSYVEFVHDSEVYNPNVLEARLQRVVYEVKIDGETVSRGIQRGYTDLSAGENAMIAIGHELSSGGSPSERGIKELIRDNDDQITIEGVMQFEVGGKGVQETYSRTYRIDLDP